MARLRPTLPLYTLILVVVIVFFFIKLGLQCCGGRCSLKHRMDHTNTPSKIQYIPQCECQREYFYPIDGKDHGSYNSSCSDEGTFYQGGQKVASFYMRFNGPAQNLRKLYKEGIPLNLERMRKYYPGYTMRLYTDTELEGDFCTLVCSNPDLMWCDVKRNPSLGDQTGIFYMSWRFFPLGDPTVDLFLSRDLDSIITERESAVVQDWLRLDKPFHLMRDKQKAHNIPILGGLWGARNYLLGATALTLRRDIIERSGVKKRYKGLDQSILNKVIFYARKKDIVAYDSYHCKGWAKHTLVRPFPRKRENTVNDFVGNYDLGRKMYDQLPVCPEECRPSYGKDWEFC